MTNTIEAYGRTKYVDSHKETFGRLKNTVFKSSLTPPFETPYTDVWPISLAQADGKKLLIGTQVANMLITSSIRLDTSMKPCIGSSNVSFQLNSAADSLCVKIYLDSVCLEEALAISKSTNTFRTSSFDIIYQLRQIRRPITRAHVCQPYTIFTLADYDRGKSPGAILTVEELASLATGRIKELLLAICRLFPSAEEDMAIINNTKLSDYLSTIANLLMPSIAAVNETVALQVSRIFDTVLS
ncbi:hypothetical protein [Parasitella parasitica]|uniref:Uncharacterized protein n=1 Tax=Parasitella parasitica TaxID=35722 RepID=A0A0B7N4I3_9FUNG|nr:hypothetical protein [Parasitella parasitica]